MNTVSGNVWTETCDGWVMRPCTASDAQRRALLASWMRKDVMIDPFTHRERHIRYADVLDQVRRHAITEPECALVVSA